MRDGGRIAAAIGVLADIDARHRPAHLALKAWGGEARYAGAKDRAFVSGLVLDVLRRRRSLGWMMGEDGDRARTLGAVRFVWDWPLERIEAAAAEPHGPGELTPGERERLARPTSLDDAPPAVRGDYPDWLDAPLERVFGAGRALEGQAMVARAPVDLRINALKSDAEHVLKALDPFHPEPLAFPPGAIRVAAPAASERAAPVEAAPAFERGWFEVQDAGSQIAAAVAGEIRGKQVLDFCAGGGGKTLALAAAMGNTGQLYAYDAGARRLADTVRRSQRAGVRNLQVRSPIDPRALDGLDGRMDLVFVDAPCTGSGTWRRHPDAKWRLTPQQLERRIAEQDAVLAAAAPFVKPGGRLIYVTCSLLAEENEDRVAAFVAAHPGFKAEPVESPGAEPWLTASGFLRLTPLSANTDGFFVAVLFRSAN
ncbi:MAG TPA: RsmB/NOP family class I SAM-dependent RNA methyltransferase [Caulobacteraceae bacterium]|jgi:16S rRNA (cytosine967-C5)-methyltransferase|nr:RsmB/NOP family class I SAM-dependent RNA methyltransferase [Caulobacteraceae bacterium]